MTTPPKQPTGARKAIGDFSPERVRLTDEVLFRQVWERSARSKRDRSLSALIALQATGQLPFRLQRGIESGLPQSEIVELITHMAFYTGWPSARSAIGALQSMARRKPSRVPYGSIPCSRPGRP